MIVSATEEPDTLPIKPFEARYKVSAIGLPVGEAAIKLTDLRGGRYHVQLEARPKFAARWMGRAELSIQASGEVRNGIIRPQCYGQKATGMALDTTLLRFDWDSGQLHTQSGSEHATLPLSAGVLDPLSMMLAAMGDLQRGQRHREYSLASETRIKTYRIHVDGKDSIPTALGKLPALRINERKPNGSRVNTFWFAPKLNYLLVQAVQRRNGFETVRLAIHRTSCAQAQGACPG